MNLKVSAKPNTAIKLIFFAAPVLMILLLLALLIPGLECSGLPGTSACTNVLFIGNSYTYC